MSLSEKLGIGGFLAAITFFFAVLVAWLTHVVWIVQTLASDLGATGGQITLGIIGTFVPPVGVIHGFVLWF